MGLVCESICKSGWRHRTSLELDTNLMGWGTMQACPLYLSELAPAHLRGSFNICFQLATAVGILAANCLNYGKRARKSEL